MNKLIQICVSTFLIISISGFPVMAQSKHPLQSTTDPAINTIQLFAFNDSMVRVAAYTRDTSAALQSRHQSPPLLTIELFPYEPSSKNRPDIRHFTLRELMKGMPYSILPVSQIENALDSTVGEDADDDQPQELEITFRLQGINPLGITASEAHLRCKLPIRNSQLGTISCQSTT